MKAVQWTVFIDMLGFKKLNTVVTTDQQAQDLLEFMISNRDVLTGHEQALAEGYRKTGGHNPYDWYDVKSTCISDSVVVTFKPKEMEEETDADQVLTHSANALMLLIFRLCMLMHKCLLEQKITFRGGISTQFCDIRDSFAVGAGLSAASETEGKAKFARIALADDVVQNEALMGRVRQLFSRMYGDSEFLVAENGITWVNSLDLMLAGQDLRSPAVSRAMFHPATRPSVLATRMQCAQYLKAQQIFVVESIREYWAAYREHYEDNDLKRVNRGILRKYFWLRHYHNETVKNRRLVAFSIGSQRSLR
ncbi:hypothetical protein [Pseudomonas sp. AK106]